MNRYPAWRYILILVLIVLGVIYALPNWYGDDPAVQISQKTSSLPVTNVTAQVKAALTKAKIPYLSVKQDDRTTLVRLSRVDDQSRAQDIIQATLGKDYSVALNLAPKTPAWLQAIGAKPMKLGLDLRGGIHFLYQVDTQGMVKERVKSDMHALASQMRDQEIRYSSISENGKDGFQVTLRSAQDHDKVLNMVEKNFHSYQAQTEQSNGKYTIRLRMLPLAVTNLTRYAVSQNITILNRRVNALGVSEPVIAPQGADQISIDLPGVQDSARAKQQIGAVATVRMQMQDTQHDAAQAAATGVVPFGSTLFTFEGRPVLLKNEVVLAGSDITNASTGVDQNGRPAVNLTVGGAGVSLFNKITAANIGKPMATVYIQTVIDKKLVDGKIKMVPRQVSKIINIATIQSALGRNFQIMGLESMQYAKDLALQLQSGAYAAPIVPVAEQVVGPSMGQHNIDLGVKACIIGSLFVFVFMLLYYRLFGFVADLALILNVIFVVAVQSLMGFTMTLPGIAALVLTVGMAVDANVLINERIREELRLGMSPHAAISAGYDRAFVTIVDANVTTLIVAAILFMFGTGPVQGFAVTLTIGLITSMITAIFFTRALINLIYGGRKQIKQLSIGIRIAKKSTSSVISK